MEDLSTLSFPKRTKTNPKFLYRRFEPLVFNLKKASRRYTYLEDSGSFFNLKKGIPTWKTRTTFLSIESSW